ncbi:LysR family transcriptional regulator [Yoonia sp.]|uniref:LysR family transcriptional regulator n=1 Tax=Yoonia sp. TaxID=2212373 RepID=UPI00391AC207
MIYRNLRHLRIFLAIAQTASVTRAAALSHVSQPAVTQALKKLEQGLGLPLFDRTPQGLFPTPCGEILRARLKRAFAYLDPALRELSPRMPLTVTTAQLDALIAVHEVENVTLAARRLGLAQPTVHRALARLEQESKRLLFKRTSYGLLATRQASDLCLAARLAFVEIGQASAEITELDGGEGGRIVLGALPLSQSIILPQALAQFRILRPTQKITVIDGLYDELLGGLRRGDIDAMLGALRDPLPIRDVVQEPLFNDGLSILARPDHPLASTPDLRLADLVNYQWVVARDGTPARQQFDSSFAEGTLPPSVIETGSILLMRELLLISNHLGCISSAQAEAEVAKGLLARLDVRSSWAGRMIGLTSRVGWMPTQGQALILDLIRDIACRTRPDRRALPL